MGVFKRLLVAVETLTERILGLAEVLETVKGEFQERLGSSSSVGKIEDQREERRRK